MSLKISVGTWKDRIEVPTLTFRSADTNFLAQPNCRKYKGLGADTSAPIYGRSVGTISLILTQIININVI